MLQITNATAGVTTRTLSESESDLARVPGASQNLTHLCDAKTNRQTDIRRFIVVVEELNLKKLKLPVSPSPQWQRQPSSPAVAARYARNTQPVRPQRPVHLQQCTRNSFKKSLEAAFASKNATLLALPWQHCAFQWWQACCCSEVA